MKLTVSIARNDSEIDALIAHLSRTASQHEKENNLDLAITYLYEVKELLKSSQSHHTTWQFLRLPKFLLKANRLSEAIDECNYLLSILDAKVNFYYENSNPFAKKAAWHREVSEIYALMSRIYRNAGMYEQYVKFNELSVSEQRKTERQRQQEEKYDQLAKKGDLKACEKMGHNWKLKSLQEPLQEICRHCGKTRSYEDRRSN